MKKDDRIGRFERFKRLRYRPTNRPTNQPTDTAYYRDVRTHLKIGMEEKQGQVGDMWIVEQMRYQQTNRPTNQPTDTASYRGALSHLEKEKKREMKMKHDRKMK